MPVLMTSIPQGGKKNTPHQPHPYLQPYFPTWNYKSPFYFIKGEQNLGGFSLLCPPLPGKVIKWLTLFYCSKAISPHSYLALLNRDQIFSNAILISVQFSHSVVSNSLWPHESQHARPLCPSPTPGVHSDSHPSSQWCHPAISSSVIPFSSCPQSLPVSESFSLSQLFAWGCQSTRVSSLASFLPKKKPRADLL